MSSSLEWADIFLPWGVAIVFGWTKHADSHCGEHHAQHRMTCTESAKELKRAEKGGKHNKSRHRSRKNKGGRNTRDAVSYPPPAQNVLRYQSPRQAGTFPPEPARVECRGPRWIDSKAYESRSRPEVISKPRHDVNKNWLLGDSG